MVISDVAFLRGLFTRVQKVTPSPLRVHFLVQMENVERWDLLVLLVMKVRSSKLLINHC